MQTTTPTRKGRLCHISNWQQQYAQLLVQPEEAAQALKNGDVIATTGGATVPRGVASALAKHAFSKGYKLEWNTVFNLEEQEYIKPEYKELFVVNSIFFGFERQRFNQGNVHYLVNHLSQTGKLVESRKPRVVIISCSPPDENGWMSRSIWGSHVSREDYQNKECEVLIVTVNKDLAFLNTGGERHLMLHVSEADYIVQEDFHMPEIQPNPSTPAEKAIADHIAEMIQDGACLQFGQGGLADAIGKNLVYAKKKDLGLQSEVVSNCIMDLMQAGVINNSRKNTYRGQSVGSAVVGNRQLWNYCHQNKDLLFVEIDWTNDTDNIRKNDNVVSINNAMEIDLTGQVCSESIGPRQYTGTGGQLEWVIGAQRSSGGKSIIAINAAYTDKQGQMQSKIKPILTPGAVVTTPRTFVQYVVTEYGVADLKYKSVKERALALINISHPDLRQGLLAEAKKLSYI